MKILSWVLPFVLGLFIFSPYTNVMAAGTNTSVNAPLLSEGRADLKDYQYVVYDSTDPYYPDVKTFTYYALAPGGKFYFRGGYSTVEQVKEKQPGINAKGVYIIASYNVNTGKWGFNEGPSEGSVLGLGPYYISQDWDWSNADLYVDSASDITFFQAPPTVMEPEEGQPIQGIQGVQEIPEQMVKTATVIVAVGLAVLAILLGISLIKRVIYSFL